MMSLTALVGAFLGVAARAAPKREAPGLDPGDNGKTALAEAIEHAWRRIETLHRRIKQLSDHIESLGEENESLRRRLDEEHGLNQRLLSRAHDEQAHPQMAAQQASMAQQMVLYHNAQNAQLMGQQNFAQAAMNAAYPYPWDCTCVPGRSAALRGQLDPP
jgi:regulator of replication initiation timing